MPDGAMTAGEFAQTLSGLSEQPLCMGDGAHLVCASDEHVRIMPEAYRFGRANGICRAAEKMYEAGLCVSGDDVIPEYHRLSQAERERAERLKKEVCK